MIGMAKGLWKYPKMQEMDWQSFKQEDSTFYFVRNHFESIGKPIILKGGKVLLVNKMLIRAQVIVTKNTHKLFHKSLSKAKYPISVQPTISTRWHRFPNSDRPMPNPSTSVQPIPLRCHRVWVANFLLPRFTKSVPPSLGNCLGQPNRTHRDLYIGLIKTPKVATFCTSRCNRVFTPVSPSWAIML